MKYTRNTKCPILTYPAEKITLPCYACLCFTHVYVVYELPPFPLPREFKTATPQSFISVPLKFTWKEFMVLLVSLKKKKTFCSNFWVQAGNLEMDMFWQKPKPYPTDRVTHIMSPSSFVYFKATRRSSHYE